MCVQSGPVVASVAASARDALLQSGGIGDQPAEPAAPAAPAERPAAHDVIARIQLLDVAQELADVGGGGQFRRVFRAVRSASVAGQRRRLRRPSRRPASGRPGVAQFRRSLGGIGAAAG